MRSEPTARLNEEKERMAQMSAYKQMIKLPGTNEHFRKLTGHTTNKGWTTNHSDLKYRPIYLPSSCFVSTLTSWLTSPSPLSRGEPQASHSMLRVSFMRVQVGQDQGPESVPPLEAGVPHMAHSSSFPVLA